MSKNDAKTSPALPYAYNDFYKVNGAMHPAVFPEGASMTRQEFADECDINVLMRRYENQDIGAIMRRSQEPMYVDFTALPSDLMSTLAYMEEAEAAFMTLPATVRREFENDPHAFVAYAADPANVEQMRSWGLAKPAPVTSAAPAAAADPTASPAPAAAPAAPSSPTAGA